MPRRVLFHVRAAVFSCLLAALTPAGVAQAHRSAANADDSGIAIAPLTHGQMAVIADYRSEILALAARQARTDETFQRLLNFGEIQYAYCLWGLVPGSLNDEASPFNECSHAYLSATQALLAYMRDMNDGTSPLKADVEALISRIDVDMVRNGASFVLCQFSDEDFNTASVIRPDLTAVPGHAPSALTFAMLAALVAAGTLGLVAKANRQKAA